jgi:hypothetical protein
MCSTSSCGGSRVAEDLPAALGQMEGRPHTCYRKMPSTQKGIRPARSSRLSLLRVFETLRLTSFTSWRGGSHDLREAI